jgi:signal transduction histidine kinase/ActR/RegA family two-component response regulator
LARPRVLIVDKPEERLPFYRSVLGEFDAETVVAYSSAGTLDQVLQEDYAVILVNLTTPAAAGLDTARLIRRNPRTRRTPIVLIGMAGPDPTLADMEGPVDYIPAPVVYEVLRSKVRIFVELHRAHEDLASAYRELEQRVTERTAQLQAANSSEKRLRREAEELSRLKDEFLATMSHELRTPLNAIFGWITLLRTGRLDPATAERALETIERNARTQKNLIDDLLDVSRIVSGKVQLELTEFDPRQVMESALATMAPAAGARRITLIPDFAVGGAPLRADFARLQQVVCNLLSNAIKFTPEGGQVWIRMDRGPGSMQITVTDTGQGISADFLPHVFDRFRQEDGSISRRHSGLGLGLAIVRHLVELHGGTVAAASPGEGHGATITVHIPAPELKGESYQPPALFEPDDLRQLSGLEVLVVDDDAVSREVVASMLQGYGAHVTTVDTGERALSLLMQKPPDVLIADLAMPQMTGIDLIQRIRNLPTAQGGKVPAIAVSAFAAAPDRLLSLQAGFDSHLAKPVEPEELARVLVNTLQQR